MIGRAYPDDVLTLPGLWTPWPPFNYGDVSATPKEASRRSQVISFRLSASEAPFAQQLWTVRLENACLAWRIMSLQAREDTWRRDESRPRQMQALHAASHAADADWIARWCLMCSGNSEAWTCRHRRE